MVDAVLHRADILDHLLADEPAAAVDMGHGRDGDHLVRVVCCEQGREPLYLQSVEYRVGYRCVCCGTAGQCIFEKNGWNGVHFYGHRCVVPGPGAYNLHLAV